MARSFVDRDRGYKNLMRLVAMKTNGAVEVGVLGPSAAQPEPESGLTVGEVAAFNELGMGVPERSFIRSFVDEGQELIQLAARQALALTRAKVKNGVVVRAAILQKDALNILGLALVDYIRIRIRNKMIGGPPNEPATVKAKGSSTPLIDSGQLFSSITHRVVDVL